MKYRISFSVKRRWVTGLVANSLDSAITKYEQWDKRPTSSTALVGARKINEEWTALSEEELSDLKERAKGFEECRAVYGSEF